MENEINLKVGKLTVNIYTAEISLSDELKSLMEGTMHVLERRLDALLGQSFSSLEANLNIVDDDEIRELNAQYREKDKATDVLSFPLQENVRRGEFDDFEGHLEMGDVFVATGVCEKQASENGLSFEEEFVHLFAHGFLHLAGYDHEENEEEDKLMRRLEDEIMETLASDRK